MTRVCFRLRVKPGRLDEYEERHRSVPAEVLDAIRDAGRRNYSIFLAPDGLLVGYYEVDDDEAAARALAADPRTTVWEAESAGFFEDLGGRADQTAPHILEVFHLEDQLSTDRSNESARS